ncbi:hypothetical protein [uncultured Porphyromonas sp.]|uniref:hypothetical protein n=1 Tax=uncultured Porphyromonas sp. TaxID=159274 RepID=UPI002602920B|nr:hypothetical protein [uncultured Porphyromonas sp.]
MEKEKNYSPSGDGHGDLPSPAEQLAIERNQRLRAEIDRMEKEIAKMEVELAKSQESKPVRLSSGYMRSIRSSMWRTRPTAWVYERSWEKAIRRTIMAIQSDSITQTTHPADTSLGERDPLRKHPCHLE